jgi:hypothetical protein
MTDHTFISAEEAADRLAIRELVDAYAHCADRRDADRQKALFTADTRFAVFMARPPGRKFQQRIDAGERAWSAAKPTQPKRDPP